ncbi:MAG: leucine-rich repeat domain-containing protein [Eubacterium sp.]|nr:leucine-rich repeat domain-containing protein [Eubacterium sp.]
MRKVKKVVLGMTVMSMMMSMAMPMSMPATAIGGLTTVSADVVAQGRCGDKVDYQYDSTTQTLTITGSGATWDNYKISVNNGDVKKIVVGKGITTIGSSLFSKMSYVDDVQIANTVTTIKQDAFAYVNGTITIPTSVKKVETNAFNGARKIVVSGDVKGYEVGAFGGQANYNYDDDYDDWSYADEGNISEICLYGSAENLGKAIYKTSVDSITIAKENKKCRIENGCLTSVDGKQLYYCINSKGKVTIPNSVETISPVAFSSVYLDKLTFGKNVKSVGDFAFVNATIKKLVLNKKLSKIGVKAFYDVSMKKVEFAGKVKMDVAAFEHHVKVVNKKKFKYAQTTLDTALYAKRKVTIKFAKVSGAKGYEVVMKKGKKTYKFTTKKNSFTTAAPKFLKSGYDVDKKYNMDNDEYLQKVSGAVSVKVRPYQFVKKSKKSKKTKKAYGMWSKEMTISHK